MRAPLPDGTDTAPGTPRRHDPFLLPSATSIRFFLIILVAGAGAMYVAFWFTPVPPLLGADSVGTAAREACADGARADAARLADHALLDAFAECVAASDRRVLLWMVAPGPAWACLTIVVHALYPVFLQWRLRPVRLPEDDGARAARREVDAALDGAGGRVSLLATPGTAGGARVFGAFGRYRVAVDTSLLVPRGDGALDARAVAVIRHEAAHLRNRDVDITYLAMSAWWAFVLLVSGPLALYVYAAVYALLVLGDPFLLVHSALPASLLTAAVLVLLRTARARVLRTREHYADVRAAEADRVGAVLRQLLARPRRPRRGSRPRRWWRARHGYHPSHRSRLDVLDEPRRLSAVSRVDLAIAGMALGAAHLHLSTAGGLGRAHGPSGTLDTAALVAVPVGALVTAIVWNAVHAYPEGAHRWRTAATALSTGILLGLLPPFQPGTWWPALLVAAPVSAAVSVLVLWGACLLFLRWAALCAGAWLPDAGRGRAVCFVGMACGAAVFGCGFGTWIHVHGVLGAEAGGGWVGLLGAPVTAFSADWRFAAAVACATVFAFSGLVLGSRVNAIARRPLTPVVAGCALAGVYAALLLAAAAVSPSAGDLTLVSVLFTVLLAAVVVSVALGAWSGGHGLRGAGPCVAAVAVLTLASWEPLVFAAVIHGIPCVATEAPPTCPAATARGVAAGYAEPIIVRLGLPVLLLLCGAGAATGSRLRSATGTPGRPPLVPAPRTRRHTVGVWAAAAAAVVVAGSIVVSHVQDDAPRVEAEARPSLRARVEPAALGREETCAETSTAVDLRVDDSPSGLITDGVEAGVVALASSRDPVLAAFGRAALDESGTPSARLFGAARSYCAAD
ncbi:M48 family metalloprotease [Nocardiopsis sp. NPDC050513]|uniref:M48 family metalloprotease n=1 Tax=Nocardiopsis sp. NPDC050513 TaxID=3364338 RepID=UPI0037A80EEC